MPTTKYFQACPSFPEDVTVAALPILSLTRLRSGENLVSYELFRSCREHGFFMLDLKDSEEGTTFLRDGEAMFDIGSKLFDLPLEELERYPTDPPRSLLGYKKAGTIRIGDGKVDATAVYTISQDDILGNIEQLGNPRTIQQNRDVCRKFIEHASEMATIILSQLDRHLNLKPGTLAGRSRLDQTSGTSIRLLQTNLGVEDRQVTFGGHTDIGTLTILFNVAGGLQILPSMKDDLPENWRFVKPIPGCVVVNIGDTLVQWTGGALKSAIHRVVTAPGEQAKYQRQSLAYLIRSADNQCMERIREGGIIPIAMSATEYEKLSVSEWTEKRAALINSGQLKVQTNGGIPLSSVA